MKKYLGIDIGGTAVKIGIVEEDGRILAKDSYSVDFDGYDTPIMATVLKSSAQFLESQHMAASDLSGIGVSATGAIDSKRGIVAGAAGHIKNWLGTKIQEELENAYHVTTRVMNDANCAALGEYCCGAARGCTDAVVITVGTGIGGGIIVNSRILEGKHGFAGEVGHFTVQCEGEPCVCGNTGCYEHYASTSALVRRVTAAVKAGKVPWNKGEEINGKTIFLHCPENKALTAVLDSWLDYVAAGVVTLVHIFNPEKVIIGGGISREKEKFIKPLAEKAFAKIMSEYKDGLVIEPALLGNDAGMVGAVYYVMQGGKA